MDDDIEWTVISDSSGVEYVIQYTDVIDMEIDEDDNESVMSEVSLEISEIDEEEDINTELDNE